MQMRGDNREFMPSSLCQHIPLVNVSMASGSNSDAYKTFVHTYVDKSGIHIPIGDLTLVNKTDVKCSLRIKLEYDNVKLGCEGRWSLVSLHWRKQ